VPGTTSFVSFRDVFVNLGSITRADAFGPNGALLLSETWAAKVGTTRVYLAFARRYSPGHRILRGPPGPRVLKTTRASITLPLQQSYRFQFQCPRLSGCSQPHSWRMCLLSMRNVRRDAKQSGCREPPRSSLGCTPGNGPDRGLASVARPIRWTSWLWPNRPYLDFRGCLQPLLAPLRNTWTHKEHVLGVSRR
jgi:hypothetical protein